MCNICALKKALIGLSATLVRHCSLRGRDLLVSGDTYPSAYIRVGGVVGHYNLPPGASLPGVKCQVEVETLPCVN